MYKRQDITNFRVPGAKPKGAQNITEVPGAWDYPMAATDSFCVQADDGPVEDDEDDEDTLKF